jgi:predicted Ser/Thr protein kinase/dienelactone hydrolase
METIAMIGETISHYRIIEKLGEGGMGIVFKAQDLTLDRLVALKFLPQDLIRDPEAKERFVHEAQAASALDHANICTVHEIGQHDGQTFIVMGYYEGETLKRTIEHGALPLVDAVNLISQVAEGLAKAHEAGIVHRDIKPANIIVTKDGVVKILDFGLAKVSGRTLHTKSGTTLGTVAYMSPEQARGEEIDARSDVWSLGVTLYELLSSKRPFESGYEQALVYLILNEQPELLQKHVPDIAPEVLAIVNRALEKRPDARYSSAGEMLAALWAYQEMLRGEAFSVKTVLRWARTPKIAIPTFAVIVGIALLSVWFFHRQEKIRWAREKAIPEIKQLIAQNDMWRNLAAPYALAVEAEKYIPDDTTLADLLSTCSVKIDITTEPPGATVSIKEYNSPEREWQELGVTPLQKARLPVDVVRWRLAKDGYDTLMAASFTWRMDSSSGIFAAPENFHRVLDKVGSVPLGMVPVQASQASNTEFGGLGDFFVDRYEVTNREYKKFIDAGGYRDRKYWKQPFKKDGKDLSWKQAMNEFVDQTNQHAPATWQDGGYPEGQGDYPVSGISWYEAAAYAEFAGKSLPTKAHWGAASGEYSFFGQFWGDCSVALNSNFVGKGVAPVGKYQGIGICGAYDMAGNVREWCWNETPRGRMIRGGAWNENLYMFYNPSERPAMDRSAENGFRCASYPKPESIAASAFQLVKLNAGFNLKKSKPVSDAIFEVYKEQFAYDNIPLNVRIESKKENPDGWVQEKITFDAAYGHERIIAYLFLPMNAKPPYQTLIYYPCGSAFGTPSSKDIEHYHEFPMFLSFVIKSGRAVLFPVYYSTFDRADLPFFDKAFGGQDDNRFYTEHMIKTVKDLKRCLDYLETRRDIDTSKIAYYGMSRGAVLGGFFPAVEKRLKVSVLLAAGGDPRGRPEVNLVNYLPRVKIPTLIMNGKYDIYMTNDGLDVFYDLLGTRSEDKSKMYTISGHTPTRASVVRETLGWLDRYLGPVHQ